MKKRKITKTKTIDGSMWYYLAEADEKEERESPPLNDFERFVLSQSVQASPEKIACFMNTDNKLNALTSDDDDGLRTLIS